MNKCNRVTVQVKRWHEMLRLQNTLVDNGMKTDFVVFLSVIMPPSALDQLSEYCFS